jgi:hypothetical protein
MIRNGLDKHNGIYQHRQQLLAGQPVRPLSLVIRGVPLFGSTAFRSYTNQGYPLPF